MVILGQHIILNLYTAILLENFEYGAMNQRMHDYEEKEKKKNEMPEEIESIHIKVAKYIKDKIRKVGFLKELLPIQEEK